MKKRFVLDDEGCFWECEETTFHEFFNASYTNCNPGPPDSQPKNGWEPIVVLILWITDINHIHGRRLLSESEGCCL